MLGWLGIAIVALVGFWTPVARAGDKCPSICPDGSRPYFCVCPVVEGPGAAPNQSRPPAQPPVIAPPVVRQPTGTDCNASRMPGAGRPAGCPPAGGGPVVPPVAATPSQVPGTVTRDCPDCPEMVVIPPGRFTMGSPSNEEGRYDDEGPQHLVNINYPFYIGEYPITKTEFARFVSMTGYTPEEKCYIHQTDGDLNETSGYGWKDPGFTQSGREPVVCVNWNDVQAYIRWLSSITGKSYRLPTEAEWEYVARAGTTTRFYWGDDSGWNTQMCRYANAFDQAAYRQHPGWKATELNCDDGYAHTSPVGSFPPNAFGIYDMAGNVWQWMEDCWNENYQGAPTNGAAWTTGSCEKRVIRGGSWDFNPRDLRSANRGWFTADDRIVFIGFRVTRTVTP